MSEAALEESQPLTGKRRLLRFGSDSVRVLTPPAVRLSGAGVQFLSTVMIARQLGDAGSALFFFWSAILTAFAPVATYGFEQLALRTAPRLDSPEKEADLRIFLGRIRFVSTALALFIGAGLMIYALVRSEGSSFQAWHLLLPFVLAAISLAIINGEALKGLSRPVAGVSYGHFIPVSLFCLLIVLNLGHLSSPLLITLYSAAYLSALLLLRFSPIPAFRASWFSKPDRPTRKTLLAEGFPVFCTNSLGALSFIIPLVLLDSFRPADEVAHVTTAFRISVLLAILATAIHGVFAPQLSKAAEHPENASHVKSVYFKITGITAGILFLPFVIGISLPEWIMSIFGEHFRDASPILLLLLISGLISLLMGPTLQLLLMIGKTRWMARLGAFKLCLVSLLSVLLIPKMGGIGMVIAMCFSFALEEIIALFIAFRHLRREETKSRN